MSKGKDMSDKMKKEFPRLKSVDRFSKLPVVETGYQYASVIYSKIKNSNFLIRWGLGSVEGTVYMVLDKSLVTIPLIQMPLNIVDDIVCKGIDQVEQRVPAINYPPELIFNITKDYVSSTFIEPVMKRADSVKKLSINGASKYGELAVSRLDNALAAADKYVDKYLPDVSDNSDVKDSNQGNKAKLTIEHAGRLSRKLKRRLTKRTLAEAKALRQQGLDTLQCILYLADLMIRDPKQFIEKINAVWNHLSEDEPENQVPPANIEQLIVMFTRETARRLVHVTNYTLSAITLMPKYSVHALHVTSHLLRNMMDYFLKEALWSHLKCGGKVDEEPAIAMIPIPVSNRKTRYTTDITPQNQEKEQCLKKEEEVNNFHNESKPQNNTEAMKTESRNEALIPNGDIMKKN